MSQNNGKMCKNQDTAETYAELSFNHSNHILIQRPTLKSDSYFMS